MGECAWIVQSHTFYNKLLEIRRFEYLYNYELMPPPPPNLALSCTPIDGIDDLYQLSTYLILCAGSTALFGSCSCHSIHWYWTGLLSNTETLKLSSHTYSVVHCIMINLCVNYYELIYQRINITIFVIFHNKK